MNNSNFHNETQHVITLNKKTERDRLDFITTWSYDEVQNAMKLRC